MVEVLIVVAAIAILATIAISTVVESGQSTRAVVAGQQQAAVQGALNAWIGAQPSIAAARSAYVNQSDKATLLSNYLDTDGIFTNAGEDLIGSDSLDAIDKCLNFTAWGQDSFPTVNMIDK